MKNGATSKMKFSIQQMTDDEFKQALKDLDQVGSHSVSHLRTHGKHVTKDTATTPMKKRLFLAFEGLKDAIKVGEVDAHVRMSHPDRDARNFLQDVGYDGFAAGWSDYVFISNGSLRHHFEFENLYILEENFMQKVESNFSYSGTSTTMECTLMIQGIFPVLASLTVHDVSIADVKSMLPVNVMDKMLLDI